MKNKTTINNSGNFNGNVINNESGQINVNYSNSVTEHIAPTTFEKHETGSTPEKEESKAVVILILEIILAFSSFKIFQGHWGIALLVFTLLFVLGLVTMQTFPIMKKLRKQGFSELPSMMAMKFPGQWLLLDNEGKIVRCKMEFHCPKCSSPLAITPKETGGYSANCPRNAAHSYTDFDYTTLDKL